MRKILLVLLSASVLFGAFTRDDATQTVYSSDTNLTWQDDGNASSQYLNWQNAVDYCANLNFAGVDDWRLPSSNELFSLIQSSYPSISPIFLNVASSYYWSSTPVVNQPSYMWGVYGHLGN